MTHPNGLIGEAQIRTKTLQNLAFGDLAGGRRMTVNDYEEGNALWRERESGWARPSSKGIDHAGIS